MGALGARRGSSCRLRLRCLATKPPVPDPQGQPGCETHHTVRFLKTHICFSIYGLLKTVAKLRLHTVPFSPADNAIMIIREVADYLKVTERTIYRLAGAKQIPAFKVGGSWRFSKTDIDRWIREQSSTADLKD